MSSLPRVTTSPLGSLRVLVGSTGLAVLVLSIYGCSDEGNPEPVGSGGASIASGGTEASGGAMTTGGVSASGGEQASGGTDATGGVGSGGEVIGSGGEVIGSGGVLSTGGSGGGAGIGGSTGDDLPELLSETGLFADIATGELAVGVEVFEPQFKLWTDGATKERWIYVPGGEKITTTDMDNWQFPVGTRLWKNFSRDDKLIETRLITRTRTGGRGWKGVAYIWNEDGSDALIARAGMENAGGTEHDVPAEEACATCHGDRPDWPLGFSAVLLSHDGAGVTMDSLISDDLLSDPPTAPVVVPGDETQRAALGYLHVNCGSCHRDGAAGEDRSGGMMTWLNVAQLGSVEETDAYTTIINQQIGSADGIDPFELRIHGGDPSKSELFRRINLRGTEDQMPPIGSELVDGDIKVIEDWIISLDPPM